jgi:hypothetical protein
MADDQSATMETKEYVEALDKEIRRFAGRLRKSFGPQIETDPSPT